MNKQTNVKPLMVNFIVPKAVKSSEPASVIYDDQNDIAYYMGGGGNSGSSSRSTRSNDYGAGSKETWHQGSRSTSADYERYTDD